MPGDDVARHPRGRPLTWVVFLVLMGAIAVLVLLARLDVGDRDVLGTTLTVIAVVAGTFTVVVGTYGYVHRAASAEADLSARVARLEDRLATPAGPVPPDHGTPPQEPADLR